MRPTRHLRALRSARTCERESVGARGVCNATRRDECPPPPKCRSRTCPPSPTRPRVPARQLRPQAHARHRVRVGRARGCERRRDHRRPLLRPHARGLLRADRQQAPAAGRRDRVVADEQRAAPERALRALQQARGSRRSPRASWPNCASRPPPAGSPTSCAASTRPAAERTSATCGVRATRVERDRALSHDCSPKAGATSDVASRFGPCPPTTRCVRPPGHVRAGSARRAGESGVSVGGNTCPQK